MICLLHAASVSLHLDFSNFFFHPPFSVFIFIRCPFLFYARLRTSPAPSLRDLLHLPHSVTCCGTPPLPHSTLRLAAFHAPSSVFTFFSSAFSSQLSDPRLFASFASSLAVISSRLSPLFPPYSFTSNFSLFLLLSLSRHPWLCPCLSVCAFTPKERSFPAKSNSQFVIAACQPQSHPPISAIKNLSVQRSFLESTCPIAQEGASSRELFDNISQFNSLLKTLLFTTSPSSSHLISSGLPSAFANCPLSKKPDYPPA